MDDLRRAVFLDRDGTINIEKTYLYRPEDWEWIPGAREAIKRFNNAGYLVVVVSNQAGVARGMYSEDDIFRLHAFVDRDLALVGARIDAYYFCPHHPEYGANRDCVCRKPKPGMLLQASDELAIDLSRSYLVGDKLTDVCAGLAAGVKPFLVKTGYGASETANAPQGTHVAEDLLSCEIPFGDAN